MSLETDLARGDQAKRLLADPTLQQAFADVRAAIIERWESASLHDRDGAHELKLMLRLLRDVQANLEAAVADGKLAQEQLRIMNRNLTPAEFAGIFRR